MSKSLRDVILNYETEPLSGDKVHVMARKEGKVVFNGYYQILASIETNYSRLFIDWPKDGVLPAEYQDHYGSSSNRFPVGIEYFKKDDIVHLSGKYLGAAYKIVIQLNYHKTSLLLIVLKFIGAFCPICGDKNSINSFSQF